MNLANLLLVAMLIRLAYVYFLLVSISLPHWRSIFSL